MSSCKHRVENKKVTVNRIVDCISKLAAVDHTERDYKLNRLWFTVSGKHVGITQTSTETNTYSEDHFEIVDPKHNTELDDIVQIEMQDAVLA